jgi:hypothetical protein
VKQLDEPQLVPIRSKMRYYIHKDFATLVNHAELLQLKLEANSQIPAVEQSEKMDSHLSEFA